MRSAWLKIWTKVTLTGIQNHLFEQTAHAAENFLFNIIFYLLKP